MAWSGSPNCQAGHDAVLAWLKGNTGQFRDKSDARGDDNILRGNVGESISYCVSLWHDCEQYRVFATNARRPFRPKSDIDLDIVWVHFGATPPR
jgi:hypothetical protein